MTDVDLALHECLVAKLPVLAAIPILGEEDARPRTIATDAAGELKRLWVLDSLDGTASYRSGLPIRAVSIGLLERINGLLTPTAGAVYVPWIDEMYVATAHEGAYATLGHSNPGAERRQLAMNDNSEYSRNDCLIVPSSHHRDFQIDAGIKCRSFGATAAHFAFAARGAAWATVAHRIKIWDLVAPHAIVRAAGGEMTYLSGSPIDYQQLLDRRTNPEPVLCASPQRLAAVLRSGLIAWKTSTYARKTAGTSSERSMSAGNSTSTTSSPTRLAPTSTWSRCATTRSASVGAMTPRWPESECVLRPPWSPGSLHRDRSA